MIDKNLIDITINDIFDLVKNEVYESNSLDYKRELHIDTPAEKRELLSDISSFANTIGWDIIYGITEEDGKPIQISWIDGNIDNLKLSIEHIVQNWLEPKVKIDVHTIKTIEDKYILIIRILQSLNKPHRVIYDNHDKFYGRSSSWKYRMDTSDLRRSFLFSNSLSERIYNFKRNRIMDIASNIWTPVPCLNDAKMILHIIPLTSFSEKISISVFDENFNTSPMQSSWRNQKYNLDWKVFYSPWDQTNSYVQIYRTWIIEAVMCYTNSDQFKVLGYSFYEETIINYLNQYLTILNSFWITAPFYVFLSFTWIKWFTITERERWFNHIYTTEILEVPEMAIEHLNNDLNKLLKPMFDMVWNAFGYTRSFNYNKEWTQIYNIYTIQLLRRHKLF